MNKWSEYESCPVLMRGMRSSPFLSMQPRCRVANISGRDAVMMSLDSHDSIMETMMLVGNPTKTVGLARAITQNKAGQAQIWQLLNTDQPCASFTLCQMHKVLTYTGKYKAKRHSSGKTCWPLPNKIPDTTMPRFFLLPARFD